MSLKLVTIGVYGFDRERFFQALVDAHIDVFCDLRARRGMRGSKYAFTNSRSLQQTLKELGIRYVHINELAPGRILREAQRQQDKELRVAKRARKVLGASFVHAYEQECLSLFDEQEFITQLGPDAQVVGLFCVEREPEACHRSLVAERLAKKLGVPVEHILSQLNE